MNAINLPKNTLKKRFGVDIKNCTQLGTGKFGIVDLVEDKKFKVPKEDTRPQFAVKIVPKKVLKNREEKQFLANEIMIQQKLDHAMICKMYEAFEDKKRCSPSCYQYGPKEFQIEPRLMGRIALAR